MTGSLDHAREWMRDGDRMLQRAGRHLSADPQEMWHDPAIHDYSRAAQMYLAGAVEYQHGGAAGRAVVASLDDAAQLIERLEGRPRSEAEAAWRAARELGASPQDEGRTASLDSARTFAESLRDRFAHAAPELFDRPSGPQHAHEPGLSRNR